jgi:hypothetical protein
MISRTTIVQKSRENGSHSMLYLESAPAFAEKSAHTFLPHSVKTMGGANPTTWPKSATALLAPKSSSGMGLMNVNRPLPQLGSAPRSSRADWSREVFAVAEALRRNGRHRRLRDVTIVLPIDHTAVEAIELACLALSEGELSEAANDLERFFDRLEQDSFEADRFLASVRGVARRVGQIGA